MLMFYSGHKIAKNRQTPEFLIVLKKISYPLSQSKHKPIYP